MYLRVSFGRLSILPGTRSWYIWARGPSVIGALRWVAPVTHNEWAPSVSQNVVNLLFSECSKHSSVIRENVCCLKSDDCGISWNLVKSLAKIMIFSDFRSKIDPKNLSIQKIFLVAKLFGIRSLRYLVRKGIYFRGKVLRYPIFEPKYSKISFLGHKNLFLQ